MTDNKDTKDTKKDDATASEAEVGSMTGSVSEEHMRDVLNHVHEDMPELVSKEDLWNCVLWIEKKYDDLDHNGVRGL